MNDRELLEAAAEAAGVKYDPDASKPHPKSGAFWGLWLTFDREPNEYDRRYWNPLTDDGDALRLAVKLNLTCRFYFGHSCAQATAPGMPSAYEDVQNAADPMAGARLAIVRAAAAMAG